MPTPSSNPWLDRKPFNWPHQGGAKEAPSNTLYAMRQARFWGADGLELDVHLTCDNKLVVCHDKTVDRTTSGKGRIRNLCLGKIQSFDSAYWWVPWTVDDHHPRPDKDYPLRHREGGPVPDDLRIPTLNEVLEEFHDVPLNLELKAGGYERELAEALRTFDRDDVIVVSFKDWVLWRFRRYAPNQPMAPGVIVLAAFWLASQICIPLPLPRGTVALQTPHRFGKFSFLNKRFLRAAARRKVAIHVWTIDNDDEMNELLDLGVHGIMTNRPKRLAELIRLRDERDRRSRA